MQKKGEKLKKSKRNEKKKRKKNRKEFGNHRRGTYRRTHVEI